MYNLFSNIQLVKLFELAYNFLKTDVKNTQLGTEYNVCYYRLINYDILNFFNIFVQLAIDWKFGLSIDRTTHQSLRAFS